MSHFAPHLPSPHFTFLKLALRPVLRLADTLLNVDVLVRAIHAREQDMGTRVGPPFAQFWSALAHVLSQARLGLLQSLVERVTE